MYQYRLIRTCAQLEFNNTNLKSLEWTDSLEFRESLYLTAEPIVLGGYELLVLRQRHFEPGVDGMFISLTDDAMLLLFGSHLPLLLLLLLLLRILSSSAGSHEHLAG